MYTAFLSIENKDFMISESIRAHCAGCIEIVYLDLADLLLIASPIEHFTAIVGDAIIVADSGEEI